MIYARPFGVVKVHAFDLAVPVGRRVISWRALCGDILSLRQAETRSKQAFIDNPCEICLEEWIPLNVARIIGGKTIIEELRQRASSPIEFRNVCAEAVDQGLVSPREALRAIDDYQAEWNEARSRDMKNAITFENDLQKLMSKVRFSDEK